MSIQFVLGRAASGKTRHCLTRILDQARADPLGPPVYYIVPKQATFLVQRQLAVGGELPGFCWIRVTSFDRFAEEILVETGGDATPVVSPRGRRLILTHLLRQLSPQLGVYREAAGRLGLAEELDRTLNELDRNGCDSVRLQQLIEQIAADNPPADSPAHQLVLKLRDVLLIQNAYHAFLGQDRIDPHRRLLQVVDAVKSSSRLARSQIFVDGHLEFSDLERRLLTALAAHAAGLTVTMLVDPASPVVRDPHQLPDELSLFHRTESTYRRLHFSMTEAGIQPLPPMVLRSAAVGRPESLGQLEKRCFGDASTPIGGASENIKLISASTRRTEVAAAAVTVREWLRSGIRPREVLLLCRSLGDYNDLIEATFPEFGIPFFADRRRPAMHHPLLQTVRAIVQAWRHGYSQDAMVTLAKSGLCNVAAEDADRLENFVLSHNLLGAAWADEKPWEFSSRARDESEPTESRKSPQSFESLRQKLVKPLRAMFRACPPTAERMPIRAYVTALLEALSDYTAPTQLAGWIESAEKSEQFELAAEHQQVWAEFIELLDEFVELLGDDALSPAEFEELLEASLAEFDLAITPATLDQVIVGEVERTRFAHFRAVIALGWNEGEFPRPAAEPSVLADSDRAEITRKKVDLDPPTQRQLLNEPLLAYLALTRASEQLAITCREADDTARLLAPSTFMRHLAQLLGRTNEGRPVLEPVDTTLATPRSVVQAMGEWACSSNIAEPSPAAAMYAMLTDDQTSLPAGLGRLLQMAWPALSYENSATLSPPIVQKLFGTELRTSVSKMEAFAACPFQHFAGKTLRLAARVEPELNSMDLGNLYHQVLESLIRDQIETKTPWNPQARPSPDAIRAAAERAGAELRGSLLLSSAQNRQLLGRAGRQLDEVMLHLHTAGAAGRLLPIAAEVVFGDRDATLRPLELNTPKGRTVALNGKIDRIDFAPEANAAAVYDYKTRGKKLNLAEVYHGLSLQLLTYLLVLEANGVDLFKTETTGIAAFYVSIMRGLEKVAHPGDCVDPSTTEFALREKVHGLFCLDFIKLLDASMTGGPGKSAVIQHHVKQNGEIGKGTEGLDADTFAFVVAFVRQKLSELADEILDGLITPHPYRLGNLTPCSNCDYRAVCRFDPSMDRYNNIPSLKSEAVIEAIKGEKHG